MFSALAQGGALCHRAVPMLMLRPLIHYADFEGRSHRGEYLQFMAAQALFAGVISVLAVRVTAFGGASIGVALTILIGFGLMAGLGLLIPNLALMVRRLHDTGRSARWIGLMVPSLLAPIVLLGSAVTLIRDMSNGAATEAMLMAQMGNLSTAGMIWFVGIICNVVLFGMLLMSGNTGSNRFGPDPREAAVLDREASDVFDDARLELLFAEARRETATPLPGLRPAQGQRPVLVHSAQISPPREWVPQAQSQGLAPARGFGRRGD